MSVFAGLFGLRAFRSEFRIHVLPGATPRAADSAGYGWREAV